MSEIDRSPAVLSSSIAVVAGVVSLSASALGAVSGGLPALGGVIVLGVGLAVASRRAVGIGGALLFLGVLVAGASGAGPEPLLVGTIGAVVAWDVGENGISVGAQLGRDADTSRGELVHATASLFVGALAAGVGYGVYQGAASGQPLTALVFLLLGTVVLVSALGR